MGNATAAIAFMMGGEGPAFRLMQDEYERSFTDGFDRYPSTIQEAVDKMVLYERTGPKQATKPGTPQEGTNTTSDESTSVVSALTGRSNLQPSDTKGQARLKGDVL
jgi:hypothetical protein